MSNRVDPSVHSIHHGLYTDGTSSWQSYISRLLDEAKDSSLPTYERIKFLAKCAEESSEIHQKEDSQRKDGDKNKLAASEVTYKALNNALNEIVGELANHRIFIPLKRKQIPSSSFQEILSYFRTFETLLQPIILGSGSSLDFQSGQSYLLLKVQHNASEELYHAYVHVPDTLPRFLKVDMDKKVYFIFVEDVVRLNLKHLFAGYKVSESFSVTYYRKHSQRVIGGRLENKIKSSVFSMLEYDHDLPIDMLGAATDLLGLSKNHLVATGRYQRLQDLHQLPNPLAPKLAAKAWRSFHIPCDQDLPSIFDDLNNRDVLLHLPYHAVDYVFRLYREASIDPHVKEIYACIQHATSNSLLINTLISAARSGKKTHVLIEEKLIGSHWAKMLLQAGIKIQALKGSVHANFTLFVRKSDHERIVYACVGTGIIDANNSHAHIQTNHMLITSHFGFTKELKSVFERFYHQKAIKEYRHFYLNSLFNQTFFKLIDNEIQHVKAGKKGHIFIKANALTDPNLIGKLYEASLAGVEIVILVRKESRIIPQQVPFSEKIKVYRLVDRYEEHSSIFVFQNGGTKKVFLGTGKSVSNPDGIDLLFPIFNKRLRRELIKYLAFQLNDNTKLRIIDGQSNNNVLLRKHGSPRIRAQFHIHEWLKGLND